MNTSLKDDTSVEKNIIEQLVPQEQHIGREKYQRKARPIAKSHQ